MEQRRLWDELPPEQPAQRPRRPRAPAPARPEAATLPLWTDPPADPPPPAPPSRPLTAPRRPSPLRPPPASPASRARPAAAAGSEPDMDTIADSLDELLEAGGAPARAVRPFLVVCPPTARWDEPDGFMPRPSSYAQAVRDVLAGRRRVRILGRDGAELELSKDSAGAWTLSP